MEKNIQTSVREKRIANGVRLIHLREISIPPQAGRTN